MSAQLQKSFNPNQQMHASSFKDTSLTYAVRYEHKLFVNECLQRGGDPVVTNARGETAFHIACSSTRSSQRTDKKRKEILQQLLEQPVKEEHNSPSTHNGVSHDMKEGLDMERSCNYHPSVWLLDMDKNTPLHLAAQSGLLGCVELLLAYGAPVLVKNASGKTPCDLASDNDHVVIVKLLESKMVFTSTEKSEVEGDKDLTFRAKTYSMACPDGLAGLRKELIQELKEELVVPGNLVQFLKGKIKIRSSVAEHLLVHYDWSKEKVLEEWKKDPRMTLCQAKLTLDDSLFTVYEHRPKMPRQPEALEPEQEFKSLEAPFKSLQSPGEFECCVCYSNYSNSERAHGLGCTKHKCCQYCFSQHVGYQVESGNAQRITCPGSECKTLILSSTVERYMPSDVKEKYQRFGLAAFVDAHDKIKWCPRKECEKVVTYPPPGGVVTVNTAVNVECEDGHTFCWACLEEPGHEPLPCEMWKRWLETIEKYHEGEVDLTRSMLAQAEAVKWIANNTKPCPKCSTKIQKTHGCNHMTCTKCRHEFCWICLDPWKLHSRTTGGYFQCNRDEETMAANRKIDAMRREAHTTANEMTEDIKMAEAKRFRILYEKYQGHLENMVIECQLLISSQNKLAELAKMAVILDSRVNKVAKVSGVDVSQPQNNIEVKDKFLYNTYGVLIRSRPILAASYALSYFLPSDEKIVLEHQESQGRLEGAVEELAGLVARHHLKTTMSEMLHVARSLVKQCEEYVCKFRPIAETCLARLTNPPEEPEDPVEEDREDRLLTLLLGNPRAMYDIFMFRILEEMEQSLIVGRHDDDSDDDDDDDDENED